MTNISMQTEDLALLIEEAQRIEEAAYFDMFDAAPVAYAEQNGMRCRQPRRI